MNFLLYGDFYGNLCCYFAKKMPCSSIRVCAVPISLFPCDWWLWWDDRSHVQRAQKYFVDAELTSMVCDSDELTDEEEDGRDKSLKVGMLVE